MQRALGIALLAVTLAVAAWRAFSGVVSGEGSDPEVKPTAEVLQGIRLLLSLDPRESAHGEALLKRLGLSIVPQLRYWVRKMQTELERVGVVLHAIEGRSGTSLSAERLSVSQFFHLKLLEAQAFSRQGEHMKALEVAGALLLLDPATPLAWDLRRLARRSREQMMSKEVLEPSIEAEKLVYEVGEEPKITFRLVNHQESEAVIEVHKGVLGEVDATVTIVLIDGSSRRNQIRLRLQAPAETRRIVIQPKKAWEQKVPFSPMDDVPLGGAVARVQIGGRFRPTDWRVDGSADLGSLGMNLSEAELWIVPPGEASQSESPLEKLAAASFFKKEQPFFVGGQLAVWAAERDAHFNEKLIETLLGSVDELDPPLLKLAVRFLQEITGENMEADPARWKLWWQKTKK